jgi:hypothetical protein
MARRLLIISYSLIVSIVDFMGQPSPDHKKPLR